MQDRLPIPTDNIYKFYALFGLLLFVFAFASMLYLVKAQNTFVAEALVEIETLKALQSPPPGQLARRQILERLVEVEKSDKTFLNCAASVLAAAGFFLMVVGFGRWHKYIQPRQDELLDLQIRKLKLELQRARRK